VTGQAAAARHATEQYTGPGLLTAALMAPEISGALW
jgi:hypothetical protein